MEIVPQGVDGTLRWVDAADAPPAGYLPVTVDEPGTGRGLAVCRAVITDPAINERGYHSGEIRTLADGALVCLVAHRGGVTRFLARENAYQQLWAHGDVFYEWVDIESLERPLLRSPIWQNNRVPGEYVTRIDTGEPIQYWVPCAAKDQQGWHIGKMAISTGRKAHCLIAINDKEGAYFANVVLYAPIK